MDEKDAEILKKLWPPLCIFICASGALILKSKVWGKNSFSLIAVIIVLTLIILGGIIGLISYKLGKKAKITALVFCLLIFASSIAVSYYMTSDAYIVKTQWPVHELEKISFAYPTELKERTLKGAVPENAEVKLLTNENTNRYVACHIYDFKMDKPSLESCVDGAVTSILTRYGAETLIWDTESTEISPSIVKGQFTYTNKIRNKTFSHTGFTFACAEGSHYEIVMFFPLRKQFSPAFMKKIEENIGVKD